MGTTFVQLARYGDIASILPAAKYIADQQGAPVDFVVHEQHADLLEAAPYTVAHIYDGDAAGVEDAIRFAKEKTPGNTILATQVNGNPVPNSQRNFIHDQWSRAGLLHLWETLPLELSIDPKRRADIRARYSRQSRQRIAVNFMGHSSMLAPSDRRMCEENAAAIAKTLGCELIDLSAMRLHNPADLIVVLECCDLLLTIDTFTVHAAYAVGLPTIVLQREIEWYQTPRRRHWVGRHDYSDLMHLETWATIKQEIVDTLRMPQSTLGRMVNVLDWFAGSDPESRRRHAFARETRAEYSGDIEQLELTRYTRTSDQTIKDTRKLPYLKDILDAGAADRPGNDVVIFCNADTCFCPETVSAIRDALKLYPAICCGRHDIRGKLVEKMKLGLAQARGEEYPGVDLFAMTVDFWHKIRDEIPDLLIACEGWDFVLWKTFEGHGGKRVAPLVYHEWHDPFWASWDQIHTNPGQQHNRQLGYEWAIKYGHGDYLGDGPTLFRSTPAKIHMDVGTICWVTGSFSAELEKIFEARPPKRILETGTHLGTGSTSIVLRLMQKHSSDAKFCTIECNPEFYADAKAFLSSKPVKVRHGLSVPRSILPDAETIRRETVLELPEGIKVDFGEGERVDRYIREVGYDAADDLIGKTLKEWDGQVDLVVLDSAGHMGWIEFQYLDRIVKSPYVLMLDDTLHVKHFRTAKFIRGSEEWRVIAEGRERNGFMIAERLPK